jgi:hypothetical protein
MGQPTGWHVSVRHPAFKDDKMNWKQALWPWGYANELEAQVVKKSADLRQAKIANVSLQGRVAAGLRVIADRDQTIEGLKTELVTTLDALRIADKRADKNTTVRDAAHKGVFTTTQPISFNERPVTKDTRQTKPKTAEQIEAAELKTAESFYAKAVQKRDASGKFEAKG